MTESDPRNDERSHVRARFGQPFHTRSITPIAAHVNVTTCPGRNLPAECKCQAKGRPNNTDFQV